MIRHATESQLTVADADMKIDLTPYLSISDLLQNAQACSRMLQLKYWTEYESGYERVAWGRGWRYRYQKTYVTDATILEYCKSLAIPPAWNNTYIAPERNSHIIATGTDDKNRTQYIYNDAWTERRTLLNFYRLPLFYMALKRLRRWSNANKDTADPETKELRIALKLLEKHYLRIGHVSYLERNKTVGLTTLLRRNITQTDADEYALEYRAKSQKLRTIVIKDREIEKFLNEAEDSDRQFIFPSWNARSLNLAIKEITRLDVTAKDFRTWGGTYAAYKHLCKNEPEVVTPAIKKTSQILGNTPAVARSSYIHPFVLRAYNDPQYASFFVPQRRRTAYESSLNKLIDTLYHDTMKEDS